MKGEGGFFEKVLGKESNSPWSKSLFFFFFFFFKRVCTAFVYFPLKMA